MDNVEYRCPSIESDGSVWFTQIKFRNDDDVRRMLSIFGQYGSKGPIKMEASLIISFEDIVESLIRSRTCEEIRDCIDRLAKELSLANP